MKMNKNCSVSLSSFIIIFSLAIVSAFNSCKKDNLSNPDGINIEYSDVAGLWKVSQFVDSGNDETADFKSITVEFVNGGDFHINENGSLSVTGNWLIVQDDGKTKLEIIVPDLTKPYAHFNNDWIVVQKSSTQLKLEDDNAGSGETFTLQKL